MSYLSESELAEKSGLSEQACSMLLNAETRAGGVFGIGDPSLQDATEWELRAAGLMSPRGFVTKLGAAMAAQLQEEYFGEPKRDWER